MREFAPQEVVDDVVGPRAQYEGVVGVGVWRQKPVTGDHKGSSA